jgi:hypothetical protein
MSAFNNFREFYPFYLSEHSDRLCRRMHFIGSTGVLLILILVLIQVLPLVWLWALPVFGYGFAWIGHFVFEKNKPATFTHPFYSFLGDWVMYKDMWAGRIAF